MFHARTLALREALALLTLGAAASAQVLPHAPPPVPRPGGLVWLVPVGGGSPVQEPSIQAAVDAAADGDTVLLSDGLFRGTGNFAVLVTGKDVRIQHRGDPARCIVDPEGLGRAFYFDGPAVTEESLLGGITIRHGCALGVCTLQSRGGGIFCDNGARPRIERCVVEDCTGGFGGAMQYFISTSLPFDPPGSVVDCVFRRNHSTSGGGALFVGDVMIERCRIVDNTSGDGGGGVFALSSRGGIRDSIVARNTARGFQGGGLYDEAGGYRIDSCTIVDNTATLGGGVSFGSDPTTTMTNTILWGNQATFGLGSQIYHMTFFGSHVATIRHCDVEGGMSGIGVQGVPPIVIGLLDVDPDFVDRPGGDYRLAPDSPLIDQGDPQLAPLTNEGDFERQPRRRGPLDLGADEHHPDPALTLPSPGRAGEPNELCAEGFAPGSLALFLQGTGTGPSPLFEGCQGPGLTLADPQPLGLTLVNARGEARTSFPVPLAASGSLILFQALAFAPVQAPCAFTQTVTFAFP